MPSGLSSKRRRSLEHQLFTISLEVIVFHREPSRQAENMCLSSFLFAKARILASHEGQFFVTNCSTLFEILNISPAADQKRAVLTRKQYPHAIQNRCNVSRVIYDRGP
jgi:hypothetical protein